MTKVILEGTVTVQASGLFEGQHPSSVGYVAISCYSLHRVFPSLPQKEDIFSNTLISSQFIEQRIFLSQRTVSSPLQRLEFPLTHRKIRVFFKIEETTHYLLGLSFHCRVLVTG